MSMAHCDTRPHQRQYASVFAGAYTPSYRHPMDMRTLLKALMALADENAYGLESRSGVPQATINITQARFTHPGIYVLSIGESLLIKRLDMTVSGDLDIISDNREKYAAQRVHVADLSQVSVAGKVVGWWTLRNS